MQSYVHILAVHRAMITESRLHLLLNFGAHSGESKNCDSRWAMWAPIRTLPSGFELSRSFNAASLLFIDLPGFQDCNFSHASIAVSQSWIALSGLSPSSNTITASAICVVFLSTSFPTNPFPISFARSIALTQKSHTAIRLLCFRKMWALFSNRQSKILVLIFVAWLPWP